MKALVLGKGVSGEGVHRFLDHRAIEHDFLNTQDVVSFDYDLVIKSPGLSYQNEVVKKLKNCKMITDIELIGMLLNREFIGVTGTNGKTTTTLLINNILRHKKKSVACGNIGYSICDAAITNNEVFVVELSSFQLCGVKSFHPYVAVILNMNKAHLDYHITEEAYYEAKTKMLINQKENEYLVYNGDDENVVRHLKGSAKRISFGMNKRNDYYYQKGYLYHQGKRIIKIAYDHLIYDKMASMVVGMIYKVPIKIMKKELKRMKTLPNRLEKIYGNIYNDAKSTNPSSTLNSIRQFKGNIILICGGIDRNEDLSLLRNDLHRLKKVFCYGETANKIFNYMEKNDVECDISSDLNEALTKIKLTKNDILLFSPMMASWDQFRNFEERGKMFCQFVKREKKNMYQ